MQHQPPGGIQGAAAYVELQAKESVYQCRQLNALMAMHTGHPVEQIERDFDRDYYMSAAEAKAYGIIDNVVTSRGELVEGSGQSSVMA